MAVKQAYFAAALMGLSACATAPAPTLGEASPAYSRLSARALDAGECGLFVWAADEEKQFIMFSQSEKQTGVWFNGTEEVKLTIQKQSGTVWYRQFDDIIYKEANGAPLGLELRDTQSIRNGTRFKAGLLKHTSSEGWEVVTPVVGLATCQS